MNANCCTAVLYWPGETAISRSQCGPDKDALCAQGHQVSVCLTCCDWAEGASIHRRTIPPSCTVGGKARAALAARTVGVQNGSSWTNVLERSRMNAVV
jgi:hypothetical protein